MPVQKVAFSLPPSLHRTVEAARKRTRQSRSAVMQEALRLWLARDQEARRVREYVEGYKRRPETRGDHGSFEDTALDAWTDLPW